MAEQRLPIIGSTSQPSIIETVLSAGLSALGVALIVERWEPRPHLLGDAIAKLREPDYVGALILAPHKERATALVGALANEARVSGALNVITDEGGRLRGYNTDVSGIRAGLAAILPRVQGKWPRTAIVLGAGGGARAAVTVLIGSGFQRVTVFNRHLHKAEALVAHFSRSARHMELRARPWHETILEAELSRSGVVVDASGQGADQIGSSVPAEALHPDLFLLDLALSDATPLMQEAKAHGSAVTNGQLSFTVGLQAAIRLWVGIEAPRDGMRAALSLVLADAATRAGGGVMAVT
jgi:shikimate dehydrogenase